MNRILRGAVVFAASALVWACNTEPDELQGGDAERIIADPVVALVPQGEVQEILVRVVDGQGTSLDAPLAVSNASAGIRVTVDPLFRPVYAPNGDLTVNIQNTEIRLVVEGLALGSNSFTLTSGGITEDVAVTVVPSDVDVTFAPAAPIAGDTTTITLPAGLKLAPGFVFRSLRGDTPVFISVAPDSLSARVILPPNIVAGDIVIDSITTIFNPAAGRFASLALRTVPPQATTTRYPGASACASAPTLPVPSSLYDLPPTVAVPRHYKFTNTGTASRTVIRRPSPSNSATALEILDAGTCAVLPAVVDTVQLRPRYRVIRNFDFVDALVDGSRTVRFSRGLAGDSTLTIVGTGAAADTTVRVTNSPIPAGTFVARVSTGPFTLPGNIPAVAPEALFFRVQTP